MCEMICVKPRARSDQEECREIDINNGEEKHSIEQKEQKKCIQVKKNKNKKKNWADMTKKERKEEKKKERQNDL